MTSTYFLRIVQDSAPIAFAYGDLDEISYIARRRIKVLDGSTETFSIRLIETSAGDIGQSEPSTVREVTAFTGDGDTAALVLKRKLAAERAEQANADQAPPEMPDQGSALPA